MRTSSAKLVCMFSHFQFSFLLPETAHQDYDASIKTKLEYFVFLPGKVRSLLFLLLRNKFVPLWFISFGERAKIWEKHHSLQVSAHDSVLNLQEIVVEAHFLIWEAVICWKDKVTTQKLHTRQLHNQHHHLHAKKMNVTDWL